MSAIVRAEPPTESLEAGTEPPATPTTNRLNMRFGSSTSDETGRPTICLDVRIIAGFGLESCGTGQAIIHNEPGREMAHFRGTWTFLEKQTSRGVGKLRVGAGFAELQVGEDHPGFKFGEPDSVDGCRSGRRGGETDHDPHRGGLASAVRTEEPGHATGLGGEGDIVDGGEAGVPPGQ